MRFIKSKSRLVLSISARDVESIVLATARLFIPRYTRKLYFLGDSGCAYPELERLAKERSGFTLVRADSKPSNLISSFRVVHRDSQLFVVPGSNARFPPEDWERVIAELENATSSREKCGA